MSGDSSVIEVIGRLHSCFPDKFGVPRQPGLSRAAQGEIEILPPYNRPEAFRGLEEISHIWVTFLFHENLSKPWQPTIRPPRLGGNKRVGVFASRSSFRPNGLGLSLLKLTQIDTTNGVRLRVSGVDMIDSTPIVDIKPYLPYADAAPNASAGWAEQPPERRLEVKFSSQARQALHHLSGTSTGSPGRYPLLEDLVEEVLSGDPRPTYRRSKADDRTYATRLYDLEVRWHVIDDTAAWVVSISPYRGG
ncbi:tRNA (N6-threonylcarbamoyladenosine(37)-N6)-methyltransferase TrmO [Hydrocarboniclastica marina]|uniref:tRNA (N6-threonylcarbamoyladenosine(37)-N6)-methyltransferase TrmO n=1 Tax=Hydrocarboniclastica marina TaxID=2259620 RepID=A0A4P7XHP0_9ALTE|nr:tRNA (N6-threonylcarbamoyladenosine(37)-N6)-methyltransferase TrmO [Hydrocarboniclastica marina]